MAKKQQFAPITEDEAVTIDAPAAPVTASASEPGTALTSAVPNRAQPGHVVSDLDTAYVASDVRTPFIVWDRAQAQTIDDAEELYGSGLYDKMHKSETILAGCVKTLKIVTLADGLSVTPSHPEPKAGAGSEDKKDFAMATKMADYVRHSLKRLADLDRPIMNILWNALDCCYKGHKLVEFTADVIDDGGDFDGKVGIASLKPKPRENYCFVLDAMNTFRGVIAKVPGGSIALRHGIVYDVSKLPNAIAPEKLYLFTLDDCDGDPRGNSWYRACFDPWNRKQALKPEEIKTGIGFGGGRVSVIAPEEDKNKNYTNPISGKTDTLMNCILAVAQGMTNGGVGVYPFGTLVNVHQPSANPHFFESSFSRYDREMVTCFLLSARTVLEARHSSKADSENAQDLLDELKIYCRSRICDVLYRLFKLLVSRSYGPDVAEQYTPLATMSKASRPDFAPNATAVAALETSGWFADDAQRASVDEEVLGIQVRSNNPLGAEIVDGDDQDETVPPEGAGGGGKGASKAPASFPKVKGTFSGRSVGRRLQAVDALRARQVGGQQRAAR